MSIPDRLQKAEHIAQTMRQRIANGDYPAGERLPARDVLRAEFDVSNATLQRAMNWLLDEGFVEAARRSGTTVRHDSPHLSRYALLFPDRFVEGVPSNQLYAALRRQALAMGPRRQITIHDGFEGRAGFVDYESLIEDMRQNRLAGLIFAAPPFVLAGTPLVADDGLPRVGLMSGSASQPHIPGVYFDTVAFARRALDMVQARGHRRIAWLCNSDGGVNPRLQALVAEHGLELPEVWYHGLSLLRPSWVRHLVRLIFAPGQPRPDAIVVADDNLLPPVSAALQELGVRAPEDVYLLAHANFPEPTASALAADRLGFSMPQLLQTAIGFIDGMRSGGERPANALIPPITEAEAHAMATVSAT